MVTMKPLILIGYVCVFLIIYGKVRTEMQPLTLIGSICIVLGIYFLGRKKRVGWVFQFSGSVLSIIHFSFIVFDISVIVLNTILAGLAVWSFFHWGEIKLLTCHECGMPVEHHKPQCIFN